MAIEAPLSKYKRNNFKIYIIVCLVLAAWFAYDGYLNKGFIDKHTDEEGQAEFTLLFNQQAPFVLVGAAVVFGVCFFVVKGKRLVAGEDALDVAGKLTIPYDAIEGIDKTHFKEKGVFTIIYKDNNGPELRRKLSDRQYDNLEAILDHLVAKIT